MTTRRARKESPRSALSPPPSESRIVACIVMALAMHDVTKSLGRVQAWGPSSSSSSSSSPSPSVSRWCAARQRRSTTCLASSSYEEQYEAFLQSIKHKKPPQPGPKSTFPDLPQLEADLEAQQEELQEMQQSQQEAVQQQQQQQQQTDRWPPSPSSFSFGANGESSSTSHFGQLGGGRHGDMTNRVSAEASDPTPSDVDFLDFISSPPPPGFDLDAVEGERTSSPVPPPSTLPLSSEYFSTSSSSSSTLPCLHQEFSSSLSFADFAMSQTADGHPETGSVPPLDESGRGFDDCWDSTDHLSLSEDPTATSKFSPVVKVPDGLTNDVSRHSTDTADTESTKWAPFFWDSTTHIPDASTMHPNVSTEHRSSNSPSSAKTTTTGQDRSKPATATTATTASTSATAAATLVQVHVDQYLPRGVTKEEAKQAWLDFCWTQGGGIMVPMERKGEDSSGDKQRQTAPVCGSTREFWVPFGLKQELVSTGANDDDEITYCMVRRGPFFQDIVMGSHIGTVQFVSAGRTTRMIWKVQFQVEDDKPVPDVMTSRKTPGGNFMADHWKRFHHLVLETTKRLTNKAVFWDRWSTWQIEIASQNLASYLEDGGDDAAGSAKP